MAEATTPDPAGIPALIEAIRHMHGATATFDRWEHVTDSHAGSVVIERTVGVFNLTGHDAGVAFAWSEPGRTSPTARRFLTIVRLPPIRTPLDAVRATVAKDAGR